LNNFILKKIRLDFIVTWAQVANGFLSSIDELQKQKLQNKIVIIFLTIIKIRL